MGDKRGSTKVTPRRQKLKISYMENSGQNESQSAPKSRPKETRRIRKDRVHPDSTRRQSGSSPSKAMVGNGAGSFKEKSHQKNKPSLTIQTQDNDRHYDSPQTPSTPNGVRGTRDLRSPGVQGTPMGAQAAKFPQSNGGAIPDFITQTDASGRATTPRSAQAIEGARKVHPSGPLPKLHVAKNGRLSEDDDDDDNDSKDMVEETCDSIVDSIRFMCCCLVPGDTEKVISGKETLDSDDKSRVKLLGPHHPDDSGKKCLVLDLDETLVHSSFRAVPGADFVIPVQIEDVVHFVYVAKRPGVDEFLVEMAKHYEIVIYTASLNKYADPLLDLLDPNNVIRARLFRESCVFYEGNYVKDLSLLDRDLSSTIIIDNSPSSYMFHPENAIDCSSFIDDPRDRELDQIGAFLTSIKDIKDVRGITMKWRDWPALDKIEEDQEETR